MMMQAHLLVGPLPTYTHNRSSGAADRRHWWRPAASSSSPGSRTSVDYEQNHYHVLGLKRSATTADIKRSYRLLALKHHPDVNKDSQSSEVFKSIHKAYEVLSNKGTRIQYDRAQRFDEDSHRKPRGRWYRWDELKREVYWVWAYEVSGDDSPLHSQEEEEDNEVEAKGSEEERGSFGSVLGSALLSLFLMQTFGYRFSLTISSIGALFDDKLDAGYKMCYLVAWILGGKGGILLTMCLSFASWACGKKSSSLVVLVVVAMWVGCNLARYAPLPQGALLALLYMSVKLQGDLN